MTADIKGNIKTDGTLDNIDMLGSIDVTNLGVAVDGQKLPSSSVDIKFKGNGIKLYTKLYTADKELTELVGNFKTGRHPKFDLNCKSNAQFKSVFDLYSLYSKYNIDSTPKFLIASITVLFMFGVFCAGWFYMVKGAVKLSKKIFILDTDRAKATLHLFKKFPVGVGKFFLSFVGVYVIFLFIQAIATPIVYLLGVNIIGGLDTESMQHLQELAINSELAANQGMPAFIDKLSVE